MGAEPIMIGRENHCGLQIIDRGVSREHAKIVRVGEMVFLHDLGSRNGSYVNGERVTEELLREGDTIRVGATQLVFESVKSERRDGIQYDEGGTFESSLELNVEDLYVIDNSSSRESEHFKAICKATNLLQLEREEKMLFAKLLDLLLDYIPASHACIFIRDEQSGTVTPVSIKRKDGAGSVPISRLILRKVINESKSILTADAMQDERFKSGDSIISKNIRSVICVPVAAAGHMHGAIYAVNSSLTEAFDQSDLQLVSAVGSQLALGLENMHQTLRRRKVYFSIIGRMLSVLEGAAGAVPGHSERIGEYCAAIAAGMGLSEREIIAASLGGLLHDIGKFGALTAHFTKLESELSNVDLQTVTAGVKLLEDIPDMQSALEGVRACRERFDGAGIPSKLRGGEIPLCGRIVSAACAFDLLLYPDASRKAGHVEGAAVRSAFENLEQRGGSEFDPETIKAMIVAYRNGTLIAIKSTPLESAEGDAPEEMHPHEASENLRKELEALSHVNTIRIKKEEAE